MAIDWGVLLRVRERSKDKALHELAQERATSERCDTAAREAFDTLVQRVDAQRRLWHDAGAAGSVAGLREAHGFDRALKQQIVQAHTAAQAAQAQAAEQRTRVEESRQRLRAALAGINSVQQMQLNVRRETTRAHETRIENGTDDGTALRWAARNRP